MGRDLGAVEQRSFAGTLVTPTERRSTLAQYAGKLDEQIALLRELRELSDRQHAIITSNALSELQPTVDTRERVMKQLLVINTRLASLRAALPRREDPGRSDPDLAPIAARRRLADSLIREILGRDRDTLEAARSARTARGDESRALEAGNATLAAYRRTLGTPSPTAVVVSQRA